MNCFNFLLFVLLSFNPVQEEFVIFQAEETKVEKTSAEYEIWLSFKILDGFYIQAETGVPENIIPTQVSFQKDPTYEITGHEISSKGAQTIYLDTSAHNVLSNNLEVLVKVKLNEKNSENIKKLRGEVYYQACNNKQCFYPRNLNFEVEFI